MLCLLSDLAVDNGEQSQYFKPDIALSAQTIADTLCEKFCSVLNRIIKVYYRVESLVGCDYYLSIAAVDCPIRRVYWCVVCAESVAGCCSAITNTAFSSIHLVRG